MGFNLANIPTDMFLEGNLKTREYSNACKNQQYLIDSIRSSGSKPGDPAVPRAESRHVYVLHHCRNIIHNIILMDPDPP